MSLSLDALTAQFSLSVLTATKGNASKRLIPDVNNRPIKDPAHTLGISAGRVEHVEVTGLADLGALMQRITPQQALVHGIPKDSTPGAVLTLVLAEKYTGAPGTIARTLECFDYPPGVRLLMCDYDPAPEAPETIASAHELVTRLTGIWPAWADVGWLATTSTSSAIRNKKTSDWLTPPEGMHVYLLATGDVVRFRDIASIQLWLAGTGYCKLASQNRHTGVCNILERCLIDLTVFSPERLDYVAGAKIDKSVPFYQDRPAPELHPGIVLDLDSLPDVTEDERADYARLVAEARARVAPEQRAKVRTHIATATPALPDAEVEHEMTTRLARAERGDLDPDQPLYFSNGTTCTAGTLTKALDGKRLRDPLEPDYGPSQAVFHWHGGDWRIVSWAHGVKKVYRLAQADPMPPEPDEADLQDLLTHAPALDSHATGTPSPDARADRADPYEATRKGLVWWKPSKDGPVVVPLTNFTARIVADVVEDDGAETRRYFELEACHEGHTIRFLGEARHFVGMAWAMEHLGARAMVLPGNLLKDHARAAVQMFSQDVEARHIYTHLGWRKIGERWCYLHAGGAIGPDGPVSDVEVDARHALAAYVLPLRTTREAQRTALRASLGLLDTAADAVTMPLYAAIWRAVLGKADFSLHLVGPTGAGKSELAALVQQHFGAGMTARRLPAAWTSTGNALEALAFEAKDALLVVDDFCPSGSQADIARFHRDADRLLRAQGNHSGRQRMRFDGTLRPVKAPRGLIVSTGEDTPQGQSLRARVLILDVAPGSVRWDKLTACQQDAADETYAQALAGFVQWLAPHYEQVSQGLHAEITTLRHAALTSGHRRTPEMVGNLALGIQYLLAYAHDSGALSLEECTALWHRSWTAVGNAGEAQSEHQANEEPVRRFLALLTGALTAGLAHVADAHTLDHPWTQPEQWGWRGHEYRKGEDVEMSWQPLGNCVGWLAHDRLYLEPEAAFSVVQKLAESQKAPLAITQQTLWKRMHEQGLLFRTSSEEKNKVRRTIGSERRYVVDISASLLSETGTSGTSGINNQNPQQNQGETLSRFPAWYTPKPGQPADRKPGQRTRVPPSLQDGQASPISCPGFPVHTVPVLCEEPGHDDNSQPQQNQGKFQENNGKVPEVPEVPEITRQYLSIGDLAWLLSAEGVQQNATPYRVCSIERGPDGRDYALFLDIETGWPLAQCTHADPPAPPVSPVDPSPSHDTHPPHAGLPLNGQPPAQACPQCGHTDWLLGVTRRRCAYCGFVDGSSVAEMRSQPKAGM